MKIQTEDEDEDEDDIESEEKFIVGQMVGAKWIDIECVIQTEIVCWQV